MDPALANLKDDGEVCFESFCLPVAGLGLTHTLARSSEALRLARGTTTVGGSLDGGRVHFEDWVRT